MKNREENDCNDLYRKVFRLLPQIACLVDSQSLTILETNEKFNTTLNVDLVGFSGLSCDILVDVLDKIEFKKALITGHLYQHFTLDIRTGDKIIYLSSIIFKFDFNMAQEHNVLKVEWSVMKLDQHTLLLTAVTREVKPSIQEPITSPDSHNVIPFSMKELVDLFQKAPVGIHCTSGNIHISSFMYSLLTA
jgi:hypothetical protein